MSRWTTGLTVMAIAVLVGVGRTAVAQDPAPADPARRSHIALTGMARMTVTRALHGAMRRLSTPECQRLFEDFTDQSGRALVTNLAATESAANVLAALYFVDGDDTVQCRTDRIVAAFTTPGSHVIHVCGQRFNQFTVMSRSGEILLIHELLHSLGLGENPPTSARITAAVMNRCR